MNVNKVIHNKVTRHIRSCSVLDIRRGSKEAEVHQSYVYNRLFTVRHICAKCWPQDKEMKNHPENSPCCPNLISMY